MEELRRFLDKVDLAKVADRAASRFWANRPPPLEGQLRALLTLEELDDHTVLPAGPGPPGSCA